MSEETHYRLRIPTPLHQKLSDAAERNHRSINSEIIARLQNSLSWDEFDLPAMSKEINGLRQELQNVHRRLSEVEELTYGRDQD